MMKFSKLHFGLRLLFVLLSLTVEVTAQHVVWLVKPQYDAISAFSEGVAAIKLNRKWGYVNELGQEIVKPEFEVAYPFSDGAGVLGAADKSIVAIADMQGKLSKPTGQYKVDNRFAQFSDGLLLVTNGEKWGYMNKSGNLSVKCKYLASMPFSEWMAAVLYDYDGGWYYIRTDGSNSIDPNPKRESYWAMGFNNGKAVVLYSNGMGSIDTKGREINGNFPKLTPPADAINYKQPSLPCKEGELIFDTKSRAIAFIDKKGKRTELSDYPQIKESVIKPQGSVVFNEKKVPFDDNSLIWHNSSMATFKAANGKYGIIALKGKPTFQISIPQDTLKSVFGNDTQLKIGLLNTSTFSADNLTVKINDNNIEEVTSVEANGKKDILFTLPKENELAMEQKSINISVTGYGLLLFDSKADVIIKDVSSIEVDVPIKHLTINPGEKCQLQVKVTNKATAKVDNVIVTLDKILQKISLDAGEERALSFEIAPTTTKVEITVKPPHSPVIANNFEVSVIVIDDVKKVQTGVTDKIDKTVITN